MRCGAWAGGPRGGTSRGLRAVGAAGWPGLYPGQRGLRGAGRGAHLKPQRGVQGGLPLQRNGGGGGGVQHTALPASGVEEVPRLQGGCLEPLGRVSPSLGPCQGHTASPCE